jgi:uncharacterized protein YndB with AHSA1/START domain
MPTFALTARSHAPVEEVWKLLHDPARFPEWWDGMAKVVRGPDGAYTMWPTGYPDYPMAQRLDSGSADGRVTISCLVSDLVYRWQLRTAGDGTDVDVEVELPEHEAHRLADQRRSIGRSLRSLVALAGEAYPDAGPGPVT